MLDKIELAWAAGFYDGEGGIYAMHKTPTYCEVAMKVAQVYLPNLQRFQAAVGGKGVLRGPYRPQGKNVQWVHHWWARSDEAFDVADMLFPLLSEVKQDQILDAVNQKMESLARFAEKKKTCRNGHDLTIMPRNARGRCVICTRLSCARNTRAYRRRLAITAEHTELAVTDGS
jgi:hypothetical protein